MFYSEAWRMGPPQHRWVRDAIAGSETSPLLLHGLRGRGCDACSFIGRVKMSKRLGIEEYYLVPSGWCWKHAVVTVLRLSNHCTNGADFAWRAQSARCEGHQQGPA